MFLGEKSAISIGWLLLVCSACRLALAYENYAPGITAAELLRRRGYQADEFYINTPSGHILRITRGRNPLIEGGYLPAKNPVLFLHGVLGNANNFLLNSFNVRPKDFTNLTINSMSLDDLKQGLKSEPSAKSLPLLALNFAHEVWLLSRRGSPGSQQLVGDPKSIEATPSSGSGQSQESIVGSLVEETETLLSPPELVQQLAFATDQKFWNYSLDGQADNDFPTTLDFILRSSPWARRVSVVGHSAGGAMTLMGLSLLPSDMLDKVSSVIMWAPSYATSNNNPAFKLLFGPFVPILSNYLGPLLLPPLLNGPLQSSLMLICSPPITWRTICEGGLDLFFGYSGGQQPMRPQFLAFGPYSSAARELTQQGQTIFYPPNHTIRKFDFGPVGNLRQYGQLAPPAYDLGVLGENFTRIAFYIGRTDFLVTPSDVAKARAQLRAPSQYHLIDTTFNHAGYFFHDDTQELAIVPSMYDLEILV